MPKIITYSTEENNDLLTPFLCQVFPKHGHQKGYIFLQHWSSFGYMTFFVPSDSCGYQQGLNLGLPGWESTMLTIELCLLAIHLTSKGMHWTTLKRAYLSRPQIQIPQRRQFDDLTCRSTGHVSKCQTQALQVAKRARAQQTSQVGIGWPRRQRQFAWTTFLLLFTLCITDKVH